MDGEVLEKHKRYLEHHVPGEVFWGLGIENETYLELYDGLQVPAEFVLHNQRRERYSVNYWTQFRPAALKAALTIWVKRNTQTQPETQPETQTVRLPLLINGHTLTKCDPWGEHRTTYTMNPTPNPKCGKHTLAEMLEVLEPEVFGAASRDVWWCYDGDTVEFMTQAFRCATVPDVVQELVAAKARWLAALQRALAAMRCERLLKGPVGWPTANHGFAVFLSNRRNVAIFNNGTYHINITAPSRLTKDGTIEDWPRFLHIHRQAARLFQWLSPFLVAVFGAGDPLAQVHRGFPAGSQRLAASRYVSVGTYDTRRMPRGKLLTTPVHEMTEPPRWWQEMYTARHQQVPRAAYVQLDAIGYDINFNKFMNHGLEFRIFDWFSEDRLEEVLEVLVWMMDRAMRVRRGADLPVPQDSAIWRRLLGNVVWEGASAILQSAELRVFAAVLGVPQLAHPFYRPVWEAYAIVRDVWKKGDYRGPCASYMLPCQQQAQPQQQPQHQPESSTYPSIALHPLLPRITWMTEERGSRPHHTLFPLPPCTISRLLLKPRLSPAQRLFQERVRAVSAQRMRTGTPATTAAVATVSSRSPSLLRRLFGRRQPTKDR